MVIRLSSIALRQIEELSLYYQSRNRIDAARSLSRTITAAMKRIEAAPDQGSLFPGPYREIGQLGHRWIKVGRYWFGYRAAVESIVITNVIFETADIPARITAEE